MAEYDVIVVGAGGTMGSNAMLQLAKAGAKVLGLEAQAEAPHARGSHHGLTRIIRLAYAEHPSYVPLLHRAYKLWDELEKESGKKLLTVTGCINMSEAGKPGGCAPGALESAKMHGLEHTELTPAQAHERFPGYCPPDNFAVVYEPYGGVLCPEACIEAAIAAAIAAGAKLETGTAVSSWSVGPDGVVTVRTAAGKSYTGKKLILAAGAWMPVLVPELKDFLIVERQVVGWFAVQRGPENFGPARFPVVVLDDENGMFYGFPADEFGFKIGRMHHRKQRADPDALDRVVVAEDEATLRQTVQRYFPDANGAMTHAAVCMFTNTPDEDFLVDLHPKHSQVVLCSACSGHGFKFGSVMGEVLKDLALKGDTPLDIEFLRFNPKRKGHAEVLAKFERLAKY